MRHSYCAEFIVYIIFLAGSMSASIAILLIIAISTSNIGQCESDWVSCEIDHDDIQGYLLRVERTFDDHLVATLKSSNTGYNQQSIDVHLGRYNFSDSIRSDDVEGLVYWNNRNSPITRCFDVKPAGQSFGCHKCNAVCLEFELKEQNQLRSDPINLIVEIKLLYCPPSDSLELCKNTVHPQTCNRRIDMKLERGLTFHMHHGGENSFTSWSPLQHTYDESVLNEERWKNHSYNFYVERTIDDRLIGLIGFANRSTDLAGTFNVSTEQFNAADIQLKCSDGQWISREYDFVCPIIDPIEHTSCGAIKFRMSYFAISCDEAHRHDGWLCYKNKRIELIQPNMGLNEEIHLGTRISTDGRSVVSTTKPVNPTYNLYNKMVLTNHNGYIYKCSIRGDYQEYVVGLERTEQHFIFQLWRHKECSKTKRKAMVQLFYRKFKTRTMLQKPCRRFCFDGRAVGKNAACNKCDKVCLFFSNMESGLSATDPIKFKFMIEHILINDKAKAQGGKRVERKTCGPRFHDGEVIQMGIGDEIMLS